MEQKAVSMLKSGMTDFCDIQQRVAAARRVEVSKRFYFHRILDMLQAKEKKYDEDKKTEDRLIIGCQSQVWLDSKMENGKMA